jgi:hypothetical protein
MKVDHFEMEFSGDVTVCIAAVLYLEEIALESNALILYMHSKYMRGMINIQYILSAHGSVTAGFLFD